MLPPAAVNLDEAHAAIELWEFYTGKVLDPTQRLAVEVMMALDVDDRWAAGTTGREMPRQNGKGDEIEVVELWGLVQRAERILHTVHDAVLLSTQSQQRMLGALEAKADLRKRIARTWKGTGQQMIEMRNGGVVWYRTRTSGGGRGVDEVDRLVVDEAQHATEEHLAALSPTLLANTNSQLNALGSAGLHGRSQWWWRQRRRALAAAPGRFGYIGHTAERLELDGQGKVVQHPVDVADRALWAAANPAVARGRGGGMEFLEEQFLRLGPDRFGEEHLCVWAPDPADSATASPWPSGVWQAVVSKDVARPSAGLVFGVAVNRDRTRTAIAVAGGGGTAGMVEERAGVGWAVNELVRLAREHGARVAVVGRHPAGTLAIDLEREGVQVATLELDDYVTACQWFYDAVSEQRIQVRRDDRLDAAVGSVMRKQSGTRFVWAARPDAPAEIVALEAVTVAAWKAQDVDVVDMAEQVW